nr:uncharacterized protein LOC108072223 [Drosophila kikkawai]
MSNLCRPFKRPCPCARSRFGWQMSNRATMPETWRPAENSNPFSNNLRGMPIKNHRGFGGQTYDFPNNDQDYPRENKKQEYQEYGNYGSQQATWDYWEPYRCSDTQPHLPPHRCYCQQPPPPPQQCYEQQQRPPPRQMCCCQNNPPPCQDKNIPECRVKKRCRRRCCRQKKWVSCGSLCVVTHEVSVQTEGKPCKPADLIGIIDVTTHEKEVRHSSGAVEITVNEVQTVTLVPGDGSKVSKNEVQSHIDSSNSDNPQRVQRQFKQEVNPDTLEVPTHPASYPSYIPNVPSSGSAAPSEFKEQCICRTNETDNHDYERNSEIPIFLEDSNKVKESKPKSFDAPSPPLKRRRCSFKVRSPTIDDVLSPKKTKTPKRPISKNTPNYDSETQTEKTKASKYIMLDSEERMLDKTDSSNTIEDSDDKLVRLPRASAFPDKSTIHVKVTNRREKHTQKGGRKSMHQDAVYETHISELRVLSPVSEEESEPEPEPEPKPKPKRRKCTIRMDMKNGYPSNDVVCRRKQKCHAPICGVPCGVPCGAGRGGGYGAGRRSCRLPCIDPCPSYLCPPRTPPLRSTQFEPICGFPCYSDR